MVDFDNLDKITNVICRPTPTLVVKHIVSLRRKDPILKDSKRNFAFNYSFNGTSGIYFDNKSEVCFEGFKIVSGNSDPKKISCHIEPKNFMSLMYAMNNAFEWLSGPKHKTTFILDANGRPIKIGDPNARESIPLTQFEYIAFKPCIIRDDSDIKYEGIAMGTKEGEMTNFVAPEFANFRMQMTNVFQNFYIATQMVITQTIQYATYKNLKEAFKK